MAFYPQENALWGQAIADTSTTQKHELGSVVRAKDSTYGVGEFIYLLGVANTVVGSLVTFDATTWQTTLAAAGTNLPRRIAVAMSANVAAQYGWYQISGLSRMAKTCGLALAAGAAVGVKTAGKVATTGTGKEISGALTVAVATNSTLATVMIDRPVLQGRVT